MKALVVLALLLAPGARAAEVGVPPIPVTAELLARWGVDRTRYADLTAQEKKDLQSDLSLREGVRASRVELVMRLAVDKCRLTPAQDCSQAWKPYVDAKGFLTPEGEALLAEYQARLKEKGLAVPASVKLERKDGKPLTAEDLERARGLLDKIYDGTAVLGASADLGPELVWDAHVQNGTLHSLRATNPRTGLSVELGQLGVDGRHPMLARSPYANLEWAAEGKPESWVDYRVRAQVGYVDLTSRWFAEPPPAAEGVDRALELAGKLGVPQAKLRDWSGYLTYDDPYKSHGIVVASLLGEMGRAYNLFGPVDITWAATSLTKVVYAAPNQAFDETLGVRVRLPGKDLYMGVFGGATENISPVGNHLMQELLSSDRVKPGFNMETAPHATVALWGKVPAVSDAAFSLRGTTRWNKDTTVAEGEASLMTTFLDRPLAIRGLYSRERGDAIEFDREKARAQVDWQFADKALAYVAFERDRIKYGNAKVDSDAVTLGIDITLGPGGQVTIDQVLGGVYRGRSDMLPGLEKTMSVMNRAVSDGLEAGDKASELWKDIRSDLEPGALAPRLDALAWSLSRMDPEAIGQLAEELLHRSLTDAQKTYLGYLLTRTLSPDSPYYQRFRDRLLEAWGQESGALLKPLDDAAAYYAAHKGEIAELARLLSDQRLWEAAAVRVGRRALMEALEKNGTQKVTIPLINRELSLTLDAPTALAASNILQSRLSPLAPVKKGDLEPFLLRQAAKSLGLDADHVTEDMIADRLFGLAQQGLTKAINDRVVPAVDKFLGDGTYDRAAAAQAILAALPPEAAAALQARFGAGLEGLLPAVGVDPAQVRDFLQNRLPGAIASYLKERYGPDLAKALAEMTGWAGELMRREINMTLIQLLLASEELNRLTADRGLKAGDHGVRMAMASFNQLDARRREEAGRRLKSAVSSLSAEAAESEDALIARLKEYGKARLEAEQLDVDWPRNLSVAIADEAWAPLLSFYGDGPLFALIDELKTKRAAAPEATPVAVSFAFEPMGSGTWISHSKDGAGLAFTLVRPRDGRDAALRLRSLASYLK